MAIMKNPAIINPRFDIYVSIHQLQNLSNDVRYFILKSRNDRNRRANNNNMLKVYFIIFAVFILLMCLRLVTANICKSGTSYFLMSGCNLKNVGLVSKYLFFILNKKIAPKVILCFLGALFVALYYG